jgi:hypothetical protein
VIYQCRNWVRGNQCEQPEGHDGPHRTRFPSGRLFEWTGNPELPCGFCGGKRWLHAADVYRDCLGANCQVDWETAATIPCPACAVQHV